MERNTTTKESNMSKQEKILDFVKTQFGIHVRTHDLTTKEEMTAAMHANKVKWIKMAIVTIG
jgi:hypothetical protein